MVHMEWYEPSPGGSYTGRQIHRILQILKSPADAWLIIRMMTWALVLPVLKRLISLQRLAQLMWVAPKTNLRNPIQEQKIATIVRWLYVFTFSTEKTCLQRSLILYRFLSLNHANPQLMTGLRREPGKNWQGHAWVMVDGKEFGALLPDPGDFKPMLSFGAQGSMTKIVDI
jgi:transglutaminase superfamily protein